MKYDVSFCVRVCVFAAHFAEGSTRRLYAGKWRLPAHTHAPTHLHTVSAVCHLCIQYVCDSPSLSVKVYLCEPVILVAFVTPFSWGVCVSCLIKVNPCEAAGAPFLSTPPPFLSLLPSTPPPFCHSIPFSFLLALWQHRRICSLKVPPSLSGSRGWRFLGNSVRVDWVGADRWLPFIGLHHWSIKMNQTRPGCTLAPLCSHPEWTVPPDTREY